MKDYLLKKYSKIPTFEDVWYFSVSGGALLTVVMGVFKFLQGSIS